MSSSMMGRWRVAKWLTVVVGLSVAVVCSVLVGLSAVAGGRRSSRFRTFHSILPQESNVVLQAFSPDGLTFEVDPVPLASRADTHTGALDHGKSSALYFLDAREDRLSRLLLETGEVEPLRIEGDCGAGRFCMDPTWAPLSDGYGRLYYLSAPSRRDPAQTSLVNEVHSARSDDGVHWRVEPGARSAGEGLVDPDIVPLDGGGYRLYFTRVHDEVDGWGATAIHSAVSPDGLNFEEEPGELIWHASASSTVGLPGGGYRMYFQGEQPGIHSARSNDGRSFTLEEGVRVPFQPASGSRLLGPTAPAVQPIEGGGWWMTLNAVLEPSFPFNDLLALESCAEDFLRRPAPPGSEGLLQLYLDTCFSSWDTLGPPPREPVLAR